MDVKRAPRSLSLLTMAGIILGAHMIWDGLFICVTGQFSPGSSLFCASREVLEIVLAHPLAGMLGVSAAQLGWYYLVLGLSWAGALTALWINQLWGWGVCLTSVLLSFTYPGYGFLLAAFSMFLLYRPAVRQWVRS